MSSVRARPQIGLIPLPRSATNEEQIMPRFITRTIHAYLDYPVALGLIAMPFLFGLGAENPLALRRQDRRLIHRQQAPIV